MVNVVQLVQRQDGANLVDACEDGAHAKCGRVGEEIDQAAHIAVKLQRALLGEGAKKRAQWKGRKRDGDGEEVGVSLSRIRKTTPPGRAFDSGSWWQVRVCLIGNSKAHPAV